MSLGAHRTTPPTIATLGLLTFDLPSLGMSCPCDWNLESSIIFFFFFLGGWWQGGYLLKGLKRMDAELQIQIISAQLSQNGQGYINCHLSIKDACLHIGGLRPDLLDRDLLTGPLTCIYNVLEGCYC